MEIEEIYRDLIKKIVRARENIVKYFKQELQEELERLNIEIGPGWGTKNRVKNLHFINVYTKGMKKKKDGKLCCITMYSNKYNKEEDMVYAVYGEIKIEKGHQKYNFMYTEEGEFCNTNLTIKHFLNDDDAKQNVKVLLYKLKKFLGINSANEEQKVAGTEDCFILKELDEIDRKCKESREKVYRYLEEKLVEEPDIKLQLFEDKKDAFEKMYHRIRVKYHGEKTYQISMYWNDKDLNSGAIHSIPGFIQFTPFNKTLLDSINTDKWNKKDKRTYAGLIAEAEKLECEDTGYALRNIVAFERNIDFQPKYGSGHDSIDCIMKREENMQKVVEKFIEYIKS